MRCFRVSLCAAPRLATVLVAAAILLVSSPARAWTAEQEAKLLPSYPRYGDCFGRSIALDGDTALVGAEGSGSRSGAAHVFTRVAGVWTEQAKLLPADGQVDDIFGYSVALSGDTALVGAPGDDDVAGSAYVFTRSGGVWTEQDKLVPAGGAAGDGFGISVALHRKTALIGAYKDDDNGVDSGSAYVFKRTGRVWTERAKLLPADGSADDCFGRSVGLDKKTAVIGAIRDADNGPWSGSAYVFDRVEGGWTEASKLMPADGEAQDHFGFAVAVDGDTVVIGATGDDQSAGSAYVFSRTRPDESDDDGDDDSDDEELSVWTEEAKLVPDDAFSWDWFGSAVAVQGEMAVIGRPGDGDGWTDMGSAYVFVRDYGGWTQQMKLLPQYGAPYDYFGSAVALDGHTAAIATPFDDNSSAVDSGSAFVFLLIDPATSGGGIPDEAGTGAGDIKALDGDVAEHRREAVARSGRAGR